MNAKVKYGSSEKFNSCNCYVSCSRIHVNKVYYLLLRSEYDLNVDSAMVEESQNIEFANKNIFKPIKLKY